MPEAFSYDSIDMNFILSLPSFGFEEKDKMPKTPGVYIVYQMSPKKKVLYVGKSNCLSSRLSNGHDINGFLSLLEHLGNELRLAYLAIESGSDDDLSLNEIVIIHKLRPLLNVDHNPNKQIFTRTFRVDKIGYNIKGESQERKSERKVKDRSSQVESKNQLSEDEAKSILEKLDTMTIREMKLAAIKVGIPGYSYMDKAVLKTAIKSNLNPISDTPKTGEKAGLYIVG